MCMELIIAVLKATAGHPCVLGVICVFLIPPLLCACFCSVWSQSEQFEALVGCQQY